MNDAEIAALPSTIIDGQHLKDWSNRRLMPLDGGPYCWHWENINHYCPPCADAFELPAERSA